jgi:hypothetical protein
MIGLLFVLRLFRQFGNSLNRAMSWFIPLGARSEWKLLPDYPDVPAWFAKSSGRSVRYCRQPMLPPPWKN